MSILPSFFVIGAQKAGTTTLHDWLETSPELMLPKIKETHFFSEVERNNLGIDWYVKQFGTKSKESKKVIGEIDPDYLFIPGCAECMQKVMDNPKLIVILREPMSRARSQYSMSCRRGYEKLTFSDALRAEQERCANGNRFSIDNHSYISRGLYAAQIMRWRAVFPHAEMLFIKFDDLIGPKTHEATLKKICLFIGIDPNLVKSDASQKSNQASEPRSVLLRDMLYGKSKIKHIVGRLIPSKDLKLKIAIWLDQSNLKAIASGVPKKSVEELPSFAHELILADLKKCVALTNLDLSDWISIHEKKMAGQK